MRDPWQDETLDGLVAYLQAAREAEAAAWAVVVTSSEGLAEEVLEEARGRIEGIEEIDVTTGGDPQRLMEERLANPRPGGFRVTVVRGLTEVLATDAGQGLLSWVNFHREDFERAAEAFVFVVLAKHASTWSRSAPDLDRYTQHFEIVDWDDIVADAQHIAGEVEPKPLPRSTRLKHAEESLERSRSLNAAFLVRALVGVAQEAMAVSALGRASTALAEARALADDVGDLERLWISVMSAELVSEQGHPRRALEDLEQINGDPDREYLDNCMGVQSFHSGQARRALALYEECLESVSDDRFVVSSSNAAVAEEWLGHHRSSVVRIQRLVEDRASVTPELKAKLLMVLGSTTIDNGLVIDALESLMESLRISDVLGTERLKVAVLTHLARAALDFGRPNRCQGLLAGADCSLGWKTAHGIGLAIVRAEASWVLSGPAAVLPVVRDERERQRGWDAPIPAAELAYVRALASVDDDEARRHLQDAADRFRAMDGWYYLSELERYLAQLDRLHGDLDRATARIEEGLTWHTREGLRPREARDRTELAMIALGRHDPQAARDSASQALELIHACNTRLYEPAALVALAAAEQALGRPEVAAAHERRWRRLVTGIGAQGLLTALERNAAWARALTNP